MSVVGPAFQAGRAATLKGWPYDNQARTRLAYVRPFRPDACGPATDPHAPTEIAGDVRDCGRGAGYRAERHGMRRKSGRAVARNLTFLHA